MGVVAEVADRVIVMYAGRVVEQGTTRADLRPTRSTPTRGACSVRSRASIGPRPGRLTAISGAPAVARARCRAGCVLRAALSATVSSAAPQAPPLIDRVGAGHLDALPPAARRCGRRCGLRSTDDEAATGDVNGRRRCCRPRTSRVTSRCEALGSCAQVGSRARRRRRVASTFARARRSASWASRAAASQRSAAALLRLQPTSPPGR